MTKRKQILIICLFQIALIAIYSALFFGHHIPLRNKNYDYYTFLGTFKSLESYLASNSDIRYFPDSLISTPHTNFLTLLVVVTKFISGLDLVILTYVFGIIGI